MSAPSATALQRRCAKVSYAARCSASCAACFSASAFARASSSRCTCSRFLKRVWEKVVVGNAPSRAARDKGAVPVPWHPRPPCGVRARPGPRGGATRPAQP